ncbi:hypothetical protein [Pseudomonas fluorescens]|uniref:hypothetical protein n=1 Tax=Pseudomonas fluorescens TaxID=294 RepID=UPI003976C936
MEQRGDAAVREYSAKFDNWAPQSLRLSQVQIDACIASLPKQTLDDVEVETLPGVVLGHRNIPVNSVGYYIPGGKYPLIASAHRSRRAPVLRTCAGDDPRPGLVPPATAGSTPRSTAGCWSKICWTSINARPWAWWSTPTAVTSPQLPAALRDALETLQVLPADKGERR